MQNKEFLYVGYYHDTEGNFILKVGTTNNLNRRKTEHNRTYKKAKEHALPEEASFEYIWSLPLSKYNTLRFEDKTRDLWKEMGIGEYIRNDRFLLCNVPKSVPVVIRKEYTISLDFWVRFLYILPIDYRPRYVV